MERSRKKVDEIQIPLTPIIEDAEYEENDKNNLSDLDFSDLDL